MNFGFNLVEQELLRYNDPLNFCKLESLQALLHENLHDFRELYQFHIEQIE